METGTNRGRLGLLLESGEKESAREERERRQRGKGEEEREQRCPEDISGMSSL